MRERVHLDHNSSTSICLNALPEPLTVKCVSVLLSAVVRGRGATRLLYAVDNPTLYTRSCCVLVHPASCLSFHECLQQRSRVRATACCKKVSLVASGVRTLSHEL